MREPFPSSACANCAEPFWKHGIAPPHTCSSGASCFVRKDRSSNTAQSFSPEQVGWLAEVCEALQGEDIAQQLVAVRKLARHPCLAPVARKVAVMKSSSAMRKRGDAQ